MNTLPYRPNVCMLIVNEKDELLIIYEKGETETYWKFPQGGVEKGETDHETIRRELEEEVRVKHYIVLAKAKYIHRYDWPEDIQKRKGFRGQEQRVYLIRALTPKEAHPGEEKILKIDWVPFDEALKRFNFPNQIEASKTVWRELKPHLTPTKPHL